MEKFLIDYTLHGDRMQFYFDGPEDIVIECFMKYLEKYLFSLPCDISLYQYKFVQNFNPNVPMYMYTEIIRGEK